ncbi:hypothetical protein [Faecalibacter rhinopitheci]|uniref:PH domain-containing protein n=1 Tax=Faecalibacter rhinopitheci TaxID=2779678 RepID=A0A8J7G4R9_9FLAO|nr:hypothetical protein [Faecalibacter rhinopitheci]MBF0596642.1 hypothetical protein [Faecalibacter rhinopitheci]
MRKRINITLHPIFVLLSSIYVLIFLTYGLNSLKKILNNGAMQGDIIGLIVCILALALFIYFLLIRYRSIEIYKDRYILNSYVFSRTIYFNEIDSIKKVPINLFNLKLGSRGILGFISLFQSQEYYNISDLSNSLRIQLKNNQIVHISCDNPEEIKMI